MGRQTRFGSRAAGAATAVVLAASVLATPLHGADDIELGIDGGRVTLVATDAPLADVLAVWSRVGDTRFVGAEPIGGERVTLRLTNAPEAEAIRLLLRTAAGHVAAPRRAGNPGNSRYDRVTILAARTTPARTRTPAAARSTAAADAPSTGTASPGLLPLEDLQRLLDATARRPAGGESDAGTTTGIPVLTTPFPGIGALRDLARESESDSRSRRTP